MDEFVSVAILVIISFCIAVASSHFWMDYRTFQSLKRDCMSMGYVQDNTTRITCAVDTKTSKE